MKRRSFVLAMAAGLVASCLGAMEARATTMSLADLLQPGATLAVQENGFDLVFSDFTYKGSGALAPTAANINVTGIFDSTSGTAGIQFQAGWTDSGQDTETTDSLIGYTVTSKGRPITDIHLYGNPSVTGGNGLVSITESVLPPNVNLTITQDNDMAAATFAPQQSLSVMKDILLFSDPIGGHPGKVSLSFVDQTFSIAVPEPTSMALLGIGMAGFFSFRRFFRRTSIA